MWLTAILAFFQAVPAIAGGINNFTNKYYDAKVQITMKRFSVDEGVAKSLISGVVAEGQTRISFLQTVASSKFLMFLIGSFSLPVAVWFGKCVLWDTVLGLGSTSPLHGQVATLANIIVGGLFGTGTVMGVGSMFFNRKNQ